MRAHACFRTLLFISIICGIFPIANAGEAPKSNVSRGDRPKVGLALPTQADERWRNDLAAMATRAGELGIDLVVQVTQNDQAQQNYHIEQLITSGVQVVIIAPQDSFGAAPAVDKAHAAGIKVISYDRLIMDADIDLFVSYDNAKIGRMQGEYLVKNAPAGNYILLGGPRYDSNAIFYKNEAMEVLQPLIDSGEIKVVLEQNVADWHPNTTRDLVESALTKAKNNIAAILVPNDGMAAGAVAALETQKLAGKVVVPGQDGELAAARRIVAGTQAMTVFKDVAKEADAALHAAMLLVKGENIAGLTGNRTVNNRLKEVPAILFEPIVVDKTNLDAVLIESGYLDGESVYQ